MLDERSGNETTPRMAEAANGHNPGAAGEADVISEGSEAVEAGSEVDTIREPQLKWMRSGSISYNGCDCGAAAEADVIVEQQYHEAHA